MYKKTTEEERIIKLYKKGKKNYYIKGIFLITIGSTINLYLGLNLMEIDLLQLSGTDFLYLFLFILIQIFIIKNILMPIILNWKVIEKKYNDVIRVNNQEKDV